jgi:hypothetical protein
MAIALPPSRASPHVEVGRPQSTKGPTGPLTLILRQLPRGRVPKVRKLLFVGIDVKVNVTNRADHCFRNSAVTVTVGGF